VLGALTYAVGLTLSAYSITPGGHQLLEILVGFGVAGTGFGVILAVVGRAAADEHRSLALGIATAAGSAGQVIGPPVAEALLAFVSWQSVFLIFAGAILASLMSLPLMRSPAPATRGELEQSMGAALMQACRDPSIALIFLGFFSCGYQLAFVTAHFPAMVTEMCGPIDPTGFLAGIGVTTTSALGAVALSVIGLANIVGTVAAAWAGHRWSKKYLLAGIYTARTLVAAAFIALPITPTSVLVFSAAMGALWLATVPLTSGLITHIYGLRYMGTLYGIVFFSHQLGSFLGVWLGGRLYDVHGDYTLVSWVGVAIGAFSAIVHLPVQERRMNAVPA
jgi:predicted MFS family arabinose efflux permease